MDAVDFRQLGDSPDVFVNVVGKTFNVHGNFTCQKELLLVELFGHLFLQGLMKELSEDDDEREDEDESKDESCGRTEFLQLCGSDNALKHGVI